MLFLISDYNFPLISYSLLISVKINNLFHAEILYPIQNKRHFIRVGSKIMAGKCCTAMWATEMNSTTSERPRCHGNTFSYIYIHTYIDTGDMIRDRFDECMEQSSGDGQWSGLARTTSIIIHHLPSSIVLHQTLIFSIHYYIKASIIIHFHICSLFFLWIFIYVVCIYATTRWHFNFLTFIFTTTGPFTFFLIYISSLLN